MKKTDNFTEKLVKALQNQIISGQLKPGDRLPPLREIALVHSVSRSVVNSAISALSAKGYLRINPRHFIIVNDFLKNGSLSVLEDIFHGDNHDLRRKMIKDTLACRLMVEIDALFQAESFSALDLVTLQDLLSKEKLWFSASGAPAEELAALDLQFHEALIGLSGNMVSSMLYHTFHYLAQPMVSLFYQVPSVIPFVLEKHVQIVDDLVRRDFPSARSRLTDLLRHGEREILPIL